MLQQLTFVVSGADAESHHSIESALTKSGRAILLKAGLNSAQVRSEILRLRPAAAIIVLSDVPDIELAVIRELSSSCPETMLIGAAVNASPDLILNSLRSGASEFLRLPILAEEFETVLDHAEEYAARQSTMPHKRGRVIAVFSNKGGCGTSFIAANLAVALGAPTVLMDLNLQAGDLGFFFQAEPKFSIANLIENQTRMDDELLGALLTRYSPNLSLLPAPSDVDAALDVRAEHVVAAIELLRNGHDYVVLDLAHTFDEITLAALDHADEILLVMTLDIMTVRNAQRVLSTLDRLDYPRERVRAIVNRWSKSDLDVGQAQIERVFGKHAVTLVPSDYRAVVNSINLGQPLVESRKSAPVAVAIKRLAAAVVAASNDSHGIGVGAAAHVTSVPRDASFMLVPADGALGKAARVNGQHADHAVGVAPRTWKGRISSMLRTG